MSKDDVTAMLDNIDRCWGIETKEVNNNE